MSKPLSKHLFYWIFPTIFLLACMFIYYYNIGGLAYIISPEENREYGLLENIQLITIAAIIWIALKKLFTANIYNKPFLIRDKGKYKGYPFRSFSYGNYIGGEWKEPVKGLYFDNVSPVNGEVFCKIPRSSEEDINLALDAAHAAKAAWTKTSVTERSNIMLKIADRIEANLEALAVAETWDNGKAVRETLNADIPLAADHFRYFAGLDSLFNERSDIQQCATSVSVDAFCIKYLGK